MRLRTFNPFTLTFPTNEVTFSYPQTMVVQINYISFVVQDIGHFMMSWIGFRCSSVKVAYERPWVPGESVWIPHWGRWLRKAGVHWSHYGLCAAAAFAHAACVYVRITRCTQRTPTLTTATTISMLLLFLFELLRSLTHLLSPSSLTALWGCPC